MNEGLLAHYSFSRVVWFDAERLAIFWPLYMARCKNCPLTVTVCTVDLTVDMLSSNGVLGGTLSRPPTLS